MSANTYGRQVVIPLTNKSGGSVAAGDVVIVDTGNNDAFTTTTTAGFTGGVGIAQETIANNATGRVLISGYAPLVNVSASVTRGHFGATHTVAKQAASAGASRGAGTFCQFLTGGTTPDAIMYPVDLLGSSLTNPMTTAGDIIVGGASGAPARLAAGTLGYPLVGGGAGVASAYAVATKAHYCRAYSAATATLTSGTEASIPLASEIGDTDSFHFPSAAALTGTVAKAAGSISIVGTGTNFTGELSVNQVISIPGGATEIGVVKTITDNTHLDLWQTMANTASGQTATRKNNYIAIPAGLAGVYLIRGSSNFVFGTIAAVTNLAILDIFINGALTFRCQDTNLAASSSRYLEVNSEPVALVAGDYIDLEGFTNTGANVTIGGTGTPSQDDSRLSIALLGT